MAAVFSPHEVGVLISMIDGAQTRGSNEIRVCRVQGGSQRRVPGLVIPLWTYDEPGQEGDEAARIPKAAETVINDLEERLEAGEVYKVQGTTKGGNEVLKTATVSTTPSTPPQATTPSSTDMGSVAWATLRGLSETPRITADLARVISDREKAVASALEAKADDQYTIGFQTARMRYEPQEDPEVAMAKYQAMLGFAQLVTTNPEARDGLKSFIGAIAKGFGVGVESVRSKVRGNDGG